MKHSHIQLGGWKGLNLCITWMLVKWWSSRYNLVQEWLNTRWSQFTNGIKIGNIFTTDAGLFFKLTIDCTLKLKDVKLRYIVHVCENMTGNKKCKLMAIGKYEKPRCMKHIK